MCHCSRIPTVGCWLVSVLLSCLSSRNYRLISTAPQLPIGFLAGCQCEKPTLLAFSGLLGSSPISNWKELGNKYSAPLCLASIIWCVIPKDIKFWLFIAVVAAFYFFFHVLFPTNVSFYPRWTDFLGCLFVRELFEDISFQIILNPKGRVIFLKTIKLCQSSWTTLQLQLALLFTKNWGSKSLDKDLQGLIVICPDPILAVPWNWQACTTLGFFLSLDHFFPWETAAYLTPSPLSSLAQISPTKWSHPDCHPIQYSTFSSTSTKHSQNPYLALFFLFPLHLPLLNILHNFLYPAII